MQGRACCLQVPDPATGNSRFVSVYCLGIQGRQCQTEQNQTQQCKTRQRQEQNNYRQAKVSIVTKLIHCKKEQNQMRQLWYGSAEQNKNKTQQYKTRQGQDTGQSKPERTKLEISLLIDLSYNNTSLTQCYNL